MKFVVAYDYLNPAWELQRYDAAQSPASAVPRDKYRGVILQSCPMFIWNRL